MTPEPLRQHRHRRRRRHRVAASLLALLALAAAARPALATSTLAAANYTVTLADGFTYVGAPHPGDGGVAAFQSVRYASPPTGPNRFRPPVAPPTADAAADAAATLVDATRVPPLCIQGGSGGAVGGAGSEDCLFVSVYAPANATKHSNLPVVVWFHGGGYTRLGSLYFPLNEFVSKGEYQVVSVFVQYRLHLFGFLSGTVLQDSAQGSVNNGILDQRLGLQWVQTNIRQFGGNPDHVFIAGQSAGAGSVMMHLVADGGEDKGLFIGAIGQSMYSIRTPSVAETDGTFWSLSSLSGCGNASATTATAALACLRGAPVGTLMAAFNTLGSSAFGPVVDGSLIREYPNVALARGDFVKVPLLAGSCTNDGAGYYGNKNTSAALVTGLQGIYPTISNATLERVFAAYPIGTGADQFADEFHRGVQAMGDAMFACPAFTAHQLLKKAGVKTFAYRFNTPNPNFAAWQGAAHASEQYWMFNGLKGGGTNGSAPLFQTPPITATGASFVTELYAYWTSFVRSRDPNPHRAPLSPYWPPHLQHSTGDREMVVQVGLGGGASGSVDEAVAAAWEARCALWNDVSEELER
ncbi:Alpha/Beta hydrolase protein [Zopfochytrium polystomum]|nr:Alpha/Beta hydrolase protein [Zopfochytrium polystomum]